VNVVAAAVLVAAPVFARQWASPTATGLRRRSANDRPTSARTNPAVLGSSMLSAGIEARPRHHESRRDLLPKRDTGLWAGAHVRRGGERHA